MASGASTEEAAAVGAIARDHFDIEMTINDYTCDACKLRQKPSKWWDPVEEESESTKWLCEACSFEVDRDTKKEINSIYAGAWWDRDARFENLHRHMRVDDA